MHKSLLAKNAPFMQDAVRKADLAREQQRTVYKQWEEDSQPHHIDRRKQVREVIDEREAQTGWKRSDYIQDDDDPTL